MLLDKCRKYYFKITFTTNDSANILMKINKLMKYLVYSNEIDTPTFRLMYKLYKLYVFTVGICERNRYFRTLTRVRYLCLFYNPLEPII